MSVEFHRFEDFMPPDGIVCSFSTRQHGILQVGYYISESDSGTVEFTKEPDLYCFTDIEQRKIKTILKVVWKLVYDSENPYKS